MDWGYLWYLVRESFKRAYLYSLAAAGTITLLFTPLVASHPELEEIARMTTFQLSLLVFGAIFFGIVLGKLLELASKNRGANPKQDKQGIDDKPKSIILKLNIDSSDFVNKDAKQTKDFFDGVSKVIRESSNNAKRNQ
jgi:hypothetical protein